MNIQSARRRVNTRARASLAAAVLISPLLGLVACSHNDADQSSNASGASQTASTVDSPAAAVTDTQPTENASRRPNPTVGSSDISSEARADDKLDPDDPRNWPQCSGLTARQALTKWVGEVPRHQPDWAWDTKWANLDGYDDCAALSYIVITIESATGSSPYQIMLFHNGQYLGTATKKAFGFAPTVTRDSDSSISVVFHWPKPGESNAERSGETYAQFAWDEQQGKVVMTGDAPPGT